MFTPRGIHGQKFILLCLLSPHNRKRVIHNSFTKDQTVKDRKRGKKSHGTVPLTKAT